VFKLNVTATPPARTISCPVYTVPSYGKWTRQGNGITTKLGESITDPTDSWNCVPYSNISPANAAVTSSVGAMTSNIMLSDNKYGYQDDAVRNGKDDINRKVIKGVAAGGCPAGTTLSGSNCVSTPPCPAGTTLSGSNCVSTPPCPAGQRLSGSSCVSTPVCPAGQTLSGSSCVRTPVCPAGQTLSGSSCVSTPNTACPTGQVKNTIGECV
jgi:hypothetical protein